MMTDKAKKFVEIMIDRGHDPNTIRNSYLENLSTEDDFDKILYFLETNKEASKADINYEIHKIHLAKRGIDIS